MSIVYSFVPLLVIGGFAFYYFRIYQKGKQAGGGMMEGLKQRQQEIWAEVLNEGEQTMSHASAFTWRTDWQYMLVNNIPITKLIWPVHFYQLVLTDQGRLLVGKTNMVGLLGKKTAYHMTDTRLRDVGEQKPGLLMKMNPLYQAFGKDHKVYDATLILPDGEKLKGNLPADFMGRVPPESVDGIPLPTLA